MIKYKYTVGEASVTVEVETMAQLLEYIEWEFRKNKENKNKISVANQCSSDLNNLQLSVKSQQILEDNDIKTVEQVVMTGKSRIRRLVGMGKTRIKEIEIAVLDFSGVKLE